MVLFWSILSLLSLFISVFSAWQGKFDVAAYSMALCIYCELQSIE
jgi:hypothetical protein